MALGGWVAVIGVGDLVAALGVAESVVGLSIVALATTAELFALAVSAHRHDLSELAVAGVVGSAGYNATVTLGGAALARPIATTGIVGASWLAAGLPLLILALGGRRGRLTRLAAGSLILIYMIYIAVLSMYGAATQTSSRSTTEPSSWAMEPIALGHHVEVPGCRSGY